jgi:hypothetical protein
MANKQKEIDITKTGPVGYKSLQAQNNAQFDDIDKFINESQSRILSRASQSDPYRDIQQMVESPLARTNTPWGESIWDNKTANQADFENLGDVRAENQPWYAKIGAGLAKGVILAGTTFLDGTIGLVLGAITKAHENRWSGLWDNDFSKFMQTVNEASEQSLPNYYSTQETEEPWYENVFTANFLGDKFIKNLGFTVGAFYSGNVFSAALKATKIPQLMGTLAKAAKFAGASEVPKMVLSGAGAAMSAVNEGRIEALNNSKQWFEDNKRVLDVEHLQRVQAIKDQYGDTAEASILIQDEIGAYNEALGKLTEDRLKMGNMDLLFNIPILTASNLFQFAKLYANGFKSSRRAVNILKRDGKFGAATTKLGATAAITRGALSEGTEEITQGMASNIAGHYYTTDVNNFYKAKTDREAEQETLDWAKSFAHGINETVNDGSAWEEFAIGAITGALGMPSFRSIKSESGSLQSPITLKGGAINEWREYKDKIKREQDIANYMNNRMQSPEFKNYYQGLIRHNKYQKDMDKATEDGDAFEFKNAEHAQLVSDILTFDNAGRLEELKGMIGEAFDTSDENLDAIVRNTTTIDENGKLVGPFADWAVKEKDGSISSNFGNEESKQKMISELTKNKDDIFKTIKQYQEIREKLDINTGQQLSDEQLEELTWMQSQLDNWSERAVSMSGEVKSAISDVLGNLDSLLRFNQQVRDFEGQSHADLTDRYKQADKNVKAIEGVINTLNMVRGQDDKVLAYTLATNPKFVDGLIKEINEVDETVLSADEKADITTKLNDIVKLGNASKTYNAKLKEYLESPQKQAEDHARADEQAAQQETKTKTNNLKDALKSATNLSEFKAALANQDELEFRDKVLKELEDEGNELAKDYRETTQYNDEVARAVNESDADPQTKQDALQLLQDQFNNSENLKELANPNSVYVNNENAFDEVSENAEESANRFLEAQYELQKAMSKINNDNRFKDRFSEEYKKPVEKREGNVKGDNRTTTGDSQTTTVPSVESSEGLPTIELPVGDVTAETIQEENKELNENAETQQKLDETDFNQFYRPAIPELHIEASKEGDFRPFDVVVKEREKGVDFSIIYNYLRDSGAFKYVNEGNLKAGDELGFMIDLRYEEKVAGQPWHKQPTIFIIDKKNGQVVGSLDESDYSISRYEGLKGLEEKIRREYAQRSAQPQQRQFKTDYQYDKEMSFYGGQVHGTLDRVENGTAIYVDSKGQPVILLAGKSDHQFIGIFREPNSNRWSMKMENKEGDKTIFRDMMSSAMTQLPLGAEIYERTSISVDGLRVFAQQLNHGFEIGNETYETDINGGDLANIFGLSKEDQEAMEKVHISEKELPRVKEILRPYLEKFGAKNIDKIIYLTNGNTLSVKLPILVKTRQATGTQSKGKFIASPTTRVSKVMVGRIPYGNTERSLKDIPNVSSTDRKPIFGIIKNGTLTTNGKVDDSLIIKPVDMSQKEGRLYLLIPNGAGKYSPAAVRVKHFNNEEFNLNDSSVNSTPVGEDIKNAITKLSTATSQDDVSAAMQDLAQDLYMQDIMVTWFSSKAGDGIVISKKVRKPDGTYEKVIINGKEQIKEDKYDVYFSTSSKSAKIGEIGEIGGVNFDVAPEDLGDTSALSTPKNPENIYNEILGHLVKFNLPLQVSARRINDGTYNNRLIESNILTSNITEASIRSNWFTMDYFDKEGKLHPAINPISRVSQSNRSGKSPVGGAEGAIRGTRIVSTFSNKPYYVDLTTNTIRDDQGRTIEITNKNRILFDLAWAQDNFGDAANSSKMVDNKVVTPDGKVLDRSKQVYLSGQEAQDVKDAINRIKKKEKASQTVEGLPIFNTSLDAQNPIEDLTPEHSMNNADEGVGYFELDGKLHKGYLTPVIGIPEVSIHITKVPNITRGFGRPGEEAHVASNSFYAVFPNGKTFLLVRNNPIKGGMSQKEIEKLFTERLSANMKKVYELSSEKTILFDPDNIPPADTTPNTTKGTPISTTKEDETKTGAAYTIQKEQAINNKKASRSRHKLRKVESLGYEKWDEKKELKWLNKVLPLLSEQDRVKVVKGLIKVGKRGTLAWGQFDKGVITLSDIAAEGTVYHEAFHVVFNLLLDNNERQSLYDEARRLYGEKDNLSLEEDMAEGFREYVTTRQNAGLLGKIKNFFKDLWIKVTNWNSIRPHLTAYYQMINRGEYSNRELPVETLSQAKARQEEYSKEMQDILANAKRDSEGNLLAPNDRPTNLTERQYAQVRTKAFKDWFGDWENDPENASKVVDENGEPLVVYHNTPFEFNGIFDMDHKSRIMPWTSEPFGHVGTQETANTIKGTQFALFLNVKNPLETPDFVHETVSSMLSELYKQGIISREKYSSLRGISNSELRNLMLSLGYDGTKYENKAEKGGTSYSFITPNQIKSATDNVGTFSRTNDDIRYREVPNSSFKSLSEEVQENLLKKGWTEEKFNSISQEERDQAVKCIAF